jgi:Zn-dependent alcohol dehydrogenase
MRAAVCCEFGRPLVVEKIDINPPQMGEVMVRKQRLRHLLR